MNRRNLLKGLLAVPVGAVAAKAVAEEDTEYKDKYWEAQRHIDELYDEQTPLYMHDGTDVEYIFKQPDTPTTLTYHDGQGRTAEIGFEGDKLVLKNHVTGRTLCV